MPYAHGKIRKLGSYRAYVVGLRMWFTGAALMGVTMWLAEHDAIPQPMVVVGIIGGAAIGAVATITAMVGRVMTARDHPIRHHSFSFIRMAMSDIFTGISKGRGEW